MGCVVTFGIRYIRFALIRVCTKKSKGGPFCNNEKFSKKRYIRNSLYQVYVISGIHIYPVCNKSGMGCVYVEGDSLALFTAMKNSPRNVISGMLQLIKSFTSLLFRKFQKSQCYSRLFLRKVVSFTNQDEKLYFLASMPSSHRQ